MKIRKFNEGRDWAYLGEIADKYDYIISTLKRISVGKDAINQIYDIVKTREKQLWDESHEGKDTAELLKNRKMNTNVG